MPAYDAYVSFSIPQSVQDNIKNAGRNPADFQLSGQKLEAVKQALDEISQTPEGRELLRKAAENSPTGKLEIFSNDGPTSFLKRSIAIGDDQDFRYEGAETGKLHVMSIQHSLVHELQHAALDHSQKRGDEDPKTNISPSKEHEAIHATNEYMRKYYGEPTRSETLDAGEFIPSTRWYINPNFKAEPTPETPENYQRQIAKLKPEELKNAGPELASLYEFRNDPKRFMEQYRELEAQGSIEFAQADLKDIQSRQPTLQPVEPDLEIGYAPTQTVQFKPG
jgi:hypothetical protein